MYFDRLCMILLPLDLIMDDIPTTYAHTNVSLMSIGGVANWFLGPCSRHVYALTYVILVTGILSYLVQCILASETVRSSVLFLMAYRELRRVFHSYEMH